MKILAQRLRILRKGKNLRQEDIARELGLSTNGYQRYELDKRDPEAPIIAALARFYQVSADYLLGLSDQP